MLTDEVVRDVDAEDRYEEHGASGASEITQDHGDYAESGVAA